MNKSDVKNRNDHDRLLFHLTLTFAAINLSSFGYFALYLPIKWKNILRTNEKAAWYLIF